MEWLKGKKTYVIAILIGVGAAAQYMGFEVPEFAWTILAALGLAAVRAGVEKK